MQDFQVTKKFVLAGKAIFTVHNNSGLHYTFKVMLKPASGNWSDTFFVYILSGPDNENDYTYMGILNKDSGKVICTKKSSFKSDSPSVKVLNWAMDILWNNKEFPDGYGCHGEGRCGKCGRLLTAEPGVNPEGFRFGFGPICWGRMNNGK